jgi:hypothetical protein
VIALMVAAAAAVVFGLVTGHWEAATGTGIAYALAGLVLLKRRQ